MSIKSTVANKLIHTYSNIIRHFIKIDPTVLIFTSMPDFTDNSLAITEYLLKNGLDKKYKIYWCVKDSKYFLEKYPTVNINFFQTSGWGAFKNMSLFFRASWIFATHGFVCYDKIAPNSDQHVIRLWHGCSYKDKDILTKKKKEDKPPFEKALVAGPLFVKTKSYFWNCPENMIIAKGYPRYDWLKCVTPEALSLYESLKGEANKVIVWMPTYRVDKDNSRSDTNNITQFPLMATNEDWFNLDALCNKLKIKLLVKLHPMQKEYDIQWRSFLNIRELTNDHFVDANTTMYSFLAVSDALISDYSSVAVDYMIVDKPIAFSLDDYELYKDGRGFVVDDPRKYMPGHHLYTIDDLQNFLSDVSNNIDRFKSDRDRLFDTLVYSSNNYCEEILKTIGFKK